MKAVGLAVADSAAFEKVIAAYGLPKDTPEAKAARSAAIADAMAGAARPPADLMAASVRLVGLAEDLLPVANKNVISDIAAAAAAISAAAVTAAAEHRGEPGRHQGPGARGGAVGDGGARRRGDRPGRPGDRRHPRGDRAVTTERGCRELSGRELARQLRAAVAERAAGLTKEGRQPRLAVVTANDDGGSAAYVRSIANAAAREGIACDVARTTTAAGITATLAQLADDPEVHGIILQTPLPEGANLADAGGGHPAGQGRGRREPRVDRPPGGGPARVRPGHRGGGAGAP